MDYLRIDASRMEALWKLQKLYKAEIGEAEPDSAGKERLAEAIRTGSRCRCRQRILRDLPYHSR